MVAYTSQFCLPYMECTDNPCTTLGSECDEVSVWCAMAQAVEAQLDVIDAVVARTATAIPQARVSLIYDTATTVLGQVPFDTTDLDTDNMVDLAALRGITPRRNGIYLIHGQLQVRDLTTNEFPDVRIRIGNEFAPGLSGVFFLGPLRGTTRGFGVGVDQWIHISGNWAFTDTAPTPRNITMVINSLSVSVLRAHLSVSWHSDLDS